MRPAMFVAIIAFTLVYIVLLLIRSRVERSADEVAKLKHDILNA
jgi:hypothetical protein